MKALRKFNMLDASSVSISMSAHFRLSIKLGSKSEAKKYEMQSIPYVSVVGSLMFDLICTRPDVAHLVSLV